MALISKIRSKVGLLVFIIAIAILAFLLMDVASNPGASAPSAVAAGTINGEDISYQSFERTAQQAVNNAQQSNPDMDESTRLRVREQAWQQEVRKTLLNQEMEKLGLQVSTTELKELLTGADPHPSIKNEPTFQNPETRTFDPQKVREYLLSLDNPDLPIEQVRASKSQWKTFEQFISSDQKQKKYNDLIKKAMYIPDWMAEKGFDNAQKKADLKYVFLPFADVDDSEVSFTDDDLQNYLDAHKNEYKQKDARSIEYIEFPIEPSEKDIDKAKVYVADLIDEFNTAENDSVFIQLYSETPYTGEYLTKANIGLSATPADTAILTQPVGTVQGPFEENNFFKALKLVDIKQVPDSVEARHILKRVNPQNSEAAAKATIDSLYTEITGNGFDFEAAAALFSDDGTNETGGHLGWVKKGQMVKPFENAIFYKADLGQVLKVRTQFGWHLVEVTKKGTTQTAYKLASLTREIAPSSETSSKKYAEANQFAGMNTTADAFRASAEKAAYEIKNANNLTSDSYVIPGIGPSIQIIAWAFNKNVGEVSSVFDLEDKYVICLLTEKKFEGTQTVDDARLRLEDGVKREKKGAILTQRAADALSSGSIESAASSLGKQVQTTSGVSFNATNVVGLENDIEVVAGAMSLEQGQVSKPILAKRGVYLVEVEQFIDAPQISSLSAVKNDQSISLKNRVDFEAFDALKKASNVSDNRLSSYVR